VSVAPDLACAAEVVRARGLAIGSPLEVLDETSSTNDVAKRAAKLGAPHGAVWVADAQTAGRGRQGRAWTAARGEALLVSVLLRPTCAASRLPPVSLVCGLAARDAVARAVAPGVDVRLKWPNDVLVDGRKVAGVLVEAMVAGSRVEGLIVGVGVNVHTRAFPPELARIATSIALHAGDRQPDRASLLADLLEGLARDVELVASRGLGLVHARLAAADALDGSRVRADTGEEGTASGIDLEGRLTVRRDDGAVVRWSAGEVHLVPPPGA